ncbi:MAG: component of the Tol biopolymer transport system [Chloroflexi bacterium]|nr:MAG: component of the Tol biopolymer transport system [Chloroflexota bacterium]
MRRLSAFLIAGAVLLGAGGVLAACGGSGEEASEGVTTAAEEAPVAEAAQAQAQAEEVGAQAEEVEAVTPAEAEAEEEAVAPAVAEAEVEEEAEEEAVDEEEEEAPEVGADAQVLAFIDGLRERACFDDAFDADGDFDYSEPPLVANCAGPHDNEVYRYRDLGEVFGAFPGETDAEMTELASTMCGQEFGFFVKQMPAASDLDFFVLSYPDAEAWEAGERRLVCVLFKQSFAKLVGSAEDRGIAFAPGMLLAFEGLRDGVLDLYAFRQTPVGQFEDSLTSALTLSNYAQPAWSPDGTQIAFDTKRDGNFEIYVMNADGSGAVNLSQNPGADDEFPDWGGSTVFDGSGIAVTVDNQDIVVLVVDGPTPSVVFTVPVTEGGAENRSQKAAWRLP